MTMTNHSILITGCSSGIGEHAAYALKKRGYRVFASARKQQDVDKLKTNGLESVLLDVTNPDSIQQALQIILSMNDGKLDALFNNAGFLQTGAIEDLTLQMNHEQFETNVFGPMELTRQVLPIMRKQGHGRIIQNSSILGIVALPYCGAYNASKFALEGFSNTLRLELRNTNIHVSIINPGPIQSKLRDNAYVLHQENREALAQSVHQKIYQSLEKSYFGREKKDKLSQSPDAVVKQLIHALESKHPRAHYFVGLPSKGLSLCRRLFPDCVLDWMLSRVR